MTKAIRIHETGGPEVLRWEDVEVGAPGPGQVRLTHAAVGLNYIDVYHRSGLYPLPELPVAIGLEAAGTVEAVGPGVGELARQQLIDAGVSRRAEIRIGDFMEIGLEVGTFDLALLNTNL